MRTDIRSSSFSSVSINASGKAERIAARREKAIMMAKVAKFVLGCYILLMFKPVIPILSDIVQHTFNAKKHMLLVHEVHGKFHIHQELANAGHQSDHEKSNELKVAVEEYLHVIPAVFKIVLDAQIRGTYLSFIYNYPLSDHRDAHYPPPKRLALNKISGALSIHGSYFGLFN